MGNSESASSDVSNNNLSRSKRPTSQSPHHKIRTAEDQSNRQQPPLRRARTSKHQDRGLRRATCPITGLTLHQKALLTRKWNRMDRGTVYEMGRRMFEQIFHENPQYLIYIDLKNEENWWNHINFKLHVQRFVTVLIETMRRLKEPSTSIDILRDFGATYAPSPKRVTALFFEKLANALNETASQLQESDHLVIEKTRSRMSTAPQGGSSDPTVAESTSVMCTSCTSLTRQGSVRTMKPLTARHSESRLFSFREESYCSSCANSRRCSVEDPNKSVCPISAEAWLVLSAFIANQIKFGYELEKLLKAEINKLGLEKLGMDDRFGLSQLGLTNGETSVNL